MYWFSFIVINVVVQQKVYCWKPWTDQWQIVHPMTQKSVKANGSKSDGEGTRRWKLLSRNRRLRNKFWIGLSPHAFGWWLGCGADGLISGISTYMYVYNSMYSYMPWFLERMFWVEVAYSTQTCFLSLEEVDLHKWKLRADTGGTIMAGCPLFYGFTYKIYRHVKNTIQCFYCTSET